MTRKISLTVFAAAQCVFAGLIATTPARAEQIPQYFFAQWTVTANCTEAQAGAATRVQAGLQFKISKSPDGAYTLQTINASGKQWASEWQGVKLTYRAGTKMNSVPADFECVAGSEATSASSSPFLAMSGYVQAVEPQYAQEHWYGLAKIHGQLEHVLIFPRPVKGENSAIIVLQSASTSGNVILDDNGVINSRD
ncbi:MAG TPA: hypothetical protein VI653_23470 [Steroidobacteraceae bacterium]